MRNKVNICWIRRDLRVSDNTALYHALQSGLPVLIVFVFDPQILDKLSDKKDKRVNFIYQALENLNKELARHGSSLYVIYSDPVNAFEKIVHDFDVRMVFTNHDYEPCAIDRDRKVSDFLATKDIAFKSFKDQVIFEKSEVMKSDGSPYTVFTPYSRVWKQKYLQHQPEVLQSEKLLQNLYQARGLNFPGLNEIGFEKADLIFPVATADEQTILKYHHNRNIPSLNGTSQLGVHLRFGTISIRSMVKLASRLNEQWLNELIWREFFMMILYHFPHVVNGSFKKKYDQIEWRNNEHEFQVWCKGETGYPIVDAGMRQLNETGWMHNRVRMIVASFLCKHLLIDWRWGEAYFAQKLLDYELASNNGNWQWAAGSGCDAAPYFRIFNPAEQTKKFDPQLIYIKTWIKDYPQGYPEPIVVHEFARKRALEVYKRSLT